jgi:hypothetical protein
MLTSKNWLDANKCTYQQIPAYIRPPGPIGRPAPHGLTAKAKKAARAIREKATK